MKVLLDEQLPVKLKHRFHPSLVVSTVRDMKWLGMKDQELFLKIRDEKVDAFITNDQNLKYQINKKQLYFSLIDLDYPSNRYEDLISIIPSLNSALVTLSQNITSTQDVPGIIFIFINQQLQEFMHL